MEIRKPCWYDILKGPDRFALFKILFSNYFETSETVLYLYGKTDYEPIRSKATIHQQLGAFGTQWGINRTMAQIHALLLISTKPITQDDIMEELSISRET